MAKFHSGTFKPRNPQKYKGNKPAVWRSSWERTLMDVFDQNPNIIEWASEPIAIPYRSPVDGLVHHYYPDFLVAFRDRSGKTRVELIEVKPASQAFTEAARTKKDKADLMINEAKWAAARLFCKQKGIFFRIMTEHDIYFTGKRKR